MINGHSSELPANRMIAMLRAINVGGHATVRMAALVRVFAAAGCRNARTYIQSGNVIFEAPPGGTTSLGAALRAQLRALLGEEPELVLRTARELDDIVRRAPFGALDQDRRLKLYVTFLSRAPRGKPELPIRFEREQLEAIAVEKREVFIVSRPKKNGFYGFPNNFVEDALGVPATTRNWNTVKRIVELVRSDAEEARSARRAVRR